MLGVVTSKQWYLIHHNNHRTDVYNRAGILAIYMNVARQVNVVERSVLSMHDNHQELQK